MASAASASAASAVARYRDGGALGGGGARRVREPGLLAGGARAARDAQAALDALSSAAGGATATLQEQRGARAEGAALREMTLTDALAEVVAAGARDGAYLLDEDLLNGLYQTEGPSEPARRVFHDVFALDEGAFGASLFGADAFPPQLAPGLALVAASRAARSSLHADPYSWLGWNLCARGCKLWTFVAPTMESDSPTSHLLQMRPKPPVAWGGDGGSDDGSSPYGIGAGAESELDLYAGFDATQLDSLADAGEEEVAFALAEQSELVRELLRAGADVRVAVQRPGEWMLIPPDWVHQVIHGPESIGVAGQHLNMGHWSPFARHVLSYCGVGADSVAEIVSRTERLARTDAADGVIALLDAALAARHGLQEAEALMDSLMGAWDEEMDAALGL